MQEAMPLAQALARRLFEYENAAVPAPAGADQPVLRICEKLQLTLCRLVGVAGSQSLLARALTLAQRDTPGLAGVEVKADGTLAGFGGDVPDQHRDAAVQAGLLLVTQLLALLHTFIGANLTLRLLQDVWPDAGLGDLRAGPQETSR